MEAIRQTIIELRALNSVKEPPQLVGAETLRILTANQVDVLKIIKEFKPEMSNRKYHQQLTSQLGFGKSNKNNSFNPFSIENLLAGSKHGVVNSLGGQVNNMFGNVGALAGLSVGALSNLGHYANNGQFSEAFNGMQAINNGAFVSAAAALANAQLDSGEQFAKRALKDGYELSDMEDDDSSSAGSYMSDEMLDVMMDDDVGAIKANEKLTLQLKNGQESPVDKRLAEDEKEQALKAADQAAVLHSLAMNLSRKEQPPIASDADGCSSDRESNSADRKDNKLKKPKKKDDNPAPRKRINRASEEACNRAREDENCSDEPNENNGKETNQIQSNSHQAKKRILSELNDADLPMRTTVKDEPADNQVASNQASPSPNDEQTDQLAAGSSSAL